MLTATVVLLSISGFVCVKVLLIPLLSMIAPLFGLGFTPIPPTAVVGRESGAALGIMLVASVVGALVGGSWPEAVGGIDGFGFGPFPGVIGMEFVGLGPMPCVADIFGGGGVPVNCAGRAPLGGGGGFPLGGGGGPFFPGVGGDGGGGIFSFT
jgi:hypothetical protein